MKKLILASVFVLGSVLAVSAQTTDQKSCHGNEGSTGKSSCCKSANTTTTNNNSNVKSCCSKGSSHVSTGTSGSKARAASANVIMNTSKTVTEKSVVTKEEPKN